MRFLFMVLGVLAYVFFFLTFLYLVGFVAGLPLLPRSVDHGPAATLMMAIPVDLALIALFGVQHSVMARPGFKRGWTRIVPPALERSVYITLASLVLIVLFAGWRPIAGVVWSLPTGIAPLIWGLFLLGWALVLLSTFLINHFELFGLQQVWLHLRERTAVAPRFYQPWLYRLVRHPLYLGFFIAFWATPRMTFGHLLLALGMSAYMLIAIRYEERDLVALFGAEYQAYQARVGMLIPGIGKRAG